MSNYKKILVSDYDKTFYLNDEDIKNNKIALKEFKEKGNVFVIATGRSLLDFKEKSALYGIDYDYLIINNGATILNKNDDILYSTSITSKIIDKLKKDLEIESSKKFFCCTKLKSRASPKDKKITKIYIKYNSKETLLRVNDTINKKYSKYINTYFITENGIEVVSKQTDKFFALEFLSKYLKIDKKYVYTIGDSYNDIRMIKNFNGYCMKDSIYELKQIAKREFSSVSELILELIDNYEQL